jgi:lipopolysaccharide biosynthesis glycosyltransferase
MESLNIFLSADENYLKHLQVAIISLLINCSDCSRLRLYILDGGLSEESKEKLDAIAKNFSTKINFCTEAQSVYNEYTVNASRMSNAAYYRISIPDVLPDVEERALYIDCDLVVEGDVLELQAIQFEQHEAIAAVQDISRTAAYRQLDIPSNQYFNSGVMLLNLPFWRSKKISDQVRQFKINSSHLLTTNDQCALNGVLWNHWQRLPPSWNQQSGVYKRRLRRKGTGYTEKEIDEAILHPKIIHYVGARKPWSPDCPHPLRHRYHLYRRFLDPSYHAPSTYDTVLASARAGTLRHLFKSAFVKKSELNTAVSE